MPTFKKTNAENQLGLYTILFLAWNIVFLDCVIIIWCGDQQTFPVKGPIVNILDIWVYVVSGTALLNLAVVACKQPGTREYGCGFQ